MNIMYFQPEFQWVILKFNQIISKFLWRNKCVKYENYDSQSIYHARYWLIIKKKKAWYFQRNRHRDLSSSSIVEKNCASVENNAPSIAHAFSGLRLGEGRGCSEGDWEETVGRRKPGQWCWVPGAPRWLSFDFPTNVNIPCSHFRTL